jgi:hypothetical protein
MRKIVLLCAPGLWTAIAFGAGNLHPLNVKPGLWQMTMTARMGAPMHYKSCLKPKDLTAAAWTKGMGLSGCTWKVLNSTSTDIELQTTGCEKDSNGTTMQLHGKVHAIDSENTTGSFDISLTDNGQAISNHADLTGKWIGATCQADMK